MSWRNIKLIFQREVRDQLRDRRTLFMIAILPLLLYPALGNGLLQMGLLFKEQTRTVVVLGSSELPDDPALLDGDRIAERWLDAPERADVIRIVQDSPASDTETSSGGPNAAAQLERARAIRDVIAGHPEWTAQLEALQDSPTKQADTAEHEPPEPTPAEQEELEAFRQQIDEKLRDTGIEVLLIVPEGFRAQLAEANAAIQARKQTIPDYERPLLVHNSANEKAILVYRQLVSALNRWERQLLEDRLAQADLPASLPEPVNVGKIDLAQAKQKAANLWSKLFPALLIIMTVTGAFYPAIDLGAGEKERGTMETLLICPANRSEIVIGKFLTVMLFSMTTAILNLLSMGLTGQQLHSMVGNRLPGDLSLPPFSALIWIVVLMIPLSAFFSALCLSLATFARSNKEGQYYLSPLLMISLGMTIFCISPGIEIAPGNESSWFYSVLPVVGVALLLKAFLLAAGDAGALYLYAVPVLCTSVVYSLIALWWAIDQFSREEVLFREAERFEVRLWLKHLLRDKEATPNFGEAVFCFVLIMLLQFVSLKFLQPSTPHGFDGTALMKMLITQQLVIIASPALFMGIMLTTNALRTFRIRRPRVQMLALALLLPLVLHPLSVELQAQLSWFFPQLPESVTRVLQAMSDQQQSLWLVLVAFAVVPAICEEIAFRGFILSGLQRSGRLGRAVVLSSLFFGIMHMIPQQVFNATLLGLVLGLLALRSGSLFPCIVFHAVFNALAILHGRLPEIWPEQAAPLDWLIRLEGGQIRYGLPIVMVALVVAGRLLVWLYQQRPRGAGRGLQHLPLEMLHADEEDTPCHHTVPTG